MKLSTQFSCAENRNFSICPTSMAYTFLYCVCFPEPVSSNMMLNLLSDYHETLNNLNNLR